MSTPTTNPIVELRAYVATFTKRCRSMRWLGALFHAGVINEIVADVRANEKEQAAAAYDSEQADREALRLIEEEMARESCPVRRKKMDVLKRLILSSAEKDHSIAEALA